MSLIQENSWRWNIPDYAYKVSKGQWLKYLWICYVLNEVQLKIARGNARIIINAPPRHGKSEGLSHWLLTWYLDWFPEKKVIFTGYGNKFAKRWGGKVKNHFLSSPFTHTKLHPARREITSWETTEGGGMESSSIDGTLAGLGADLFVIDDPHKNFQEALSPTKRLTVTEGYEANIRTRLEPGASIVLIMTRWHERDLCGYLLSKSDHNWDVIKLPAIAEENDLLGRALGEALCPERYPLKKPSGVVVGDSLLELKKDIGSFKFAGLFQQRPAPLEGQHIKRKWFRHWTLLPEMDEWLQSWDLSFGDTGKSFVCGQLWGRKAANYFLVDQFRKNIDFPTTLKEFKKFCEKHPYALKKVIENKANGPALISTVKNTISGVLPQNPCGNKLARLIEVSPAIESGNVFLPPRDIHWVDDLIDEVVFCPNAANDDQADCLSQALDRLIKVKRVGNIRLPDYGSQDSAWDGF